MNFFQRTLVAILLGCLALPSSSGSESTWIYSVQVHASVSADPARVTLQWPADHVPATAITIWRKGLDEMVWGPAMSLPPGATSFVDPHVTVGGVYEYQIEKVTATFSAWGYIAVGINAPLVESRGKIVLVVDRDIAGPLGGELRRLERDLVGDGWGVIRREVGRGDTPHSVRDMIRAEWGADRANVKSVFLFGHVPVVRSGLANVDGHVGRPMPADVFYADMDGLWTDANADGVLDQGGLPSDVELEIGRVDFANLPGAYSGSPFPGEIDLLRRYLNKDHAFRQAMVRPPLRALMGNPIGDFRGQAFAASGYRTFAALVGPENVVEAGSELHTPVHERWISKVTAAPYLWAYGGSAGGDYTLGALGTHGQYNDVWGADFIQQGAKATFYMFFGSWIGEWDKTDNFLRSTIAAPEYGLTAVWSGRPHFYFHPMGVGHPIGRSIRLSQNNDGLAYRNQIQRHARGVHMALIGDPTLRLNQVAPPTNVRATVNNAEVALSWNPSPDAVFGYRIYRSVSPGAPFERISAELHGGTQFIDQPPNPAATTYMVRAVVLQLGPSGSYYNASQGAFNRDDFAIPSNSPLPLAADPFPGKISGAATEVGSDIQHPNGNVFDQVLLQGNYAVGSADPGQVLRISFLDPQDDIVQVQMSGAGRLSVLLDTSSGPAAPAKYNQGVAYMKGLAAIGISGADETTHVSIFSVGRGNAVNPALFQDVAYDGIADIAVLTITTANGKFGSVLTANTRYSANKGLTGIYASDVEFAGPVLIGDIDAHGSALPVLQLGAAGTDFDKLNLVQVAGGDLAQANGRPVSLSGIRRVQFVAGMTSHNVSLPPQANRGRLEVLGADVSASIVLGP